MKNEKLIIYQLFPRIFTNTNGSCIPWGRLDQNGSGKMNEITSKVLKSIKELGVNCIWYTGIIENSTKTAYPEYNIPADDPHIVKGEAGSPYAIKDYYDIAPAIAEGINNRMSEFEALVKRTHDEDMKVLIDFVPNHTARCYHSDSAPSGVKDFGECDDTTKFFSPGNNYYYLTNQQFSPGIDIGGYVEFPAKATGNDCFTAFPGEYDWYETVKLNYGKDYGNGSWHYNPIPDTWFKMLNILRFWASKGVDGFRCDMVFMVPLEFWSWAIPNVKKDYPNIIFIGEIYNVGQYRDFLNIGHFDYLYDKVNLYDTLVGIQKNNVSAAQLTGAWQTVDGIGDRMLNFIENHDEVRFASKEYAGDPQLVIPSLVISSMFNRGPMMIYYGQEIGEPASDNEGFAGNNNRTTIFDYWSLDTLRRWYNNGECDGAKLTPKEKWLREKYKKILTLCNSEKSISEGSFFDLMYVNLHNPTVNPHRHFIFLRHYNNDSLLIAVNFSEHKAEMRINIPDDAFNMLNLPEGTLNCIELLTGDKNKKDIIRGTQFMTEVNAYNAVIWKFTKKVINKK